MVASSTPPGTSKPTIESVTSQFASSTLQEPHVATTSSSATTNCADSKAKNTRVDDNNVACMVDGYKGVPGFPDFPLIWCVEEGGGTSARSESVRVNETLRAKEECQQSSSLVLVGFEALSRRPSNRKKFSFIRRAVNVAGIKRNKLNRGKPPREITSEKVAITKVTTTSNKKWQLRDPQLLCKRMSSLQIRSTTSTAATIITSIPTATSGKQPAKIID